MQNVQWKFTKTVPGKIVTFVGITLSYLLIGFLSLKVATINDNASPIWAPSGFAIGSLLAFGVRYAPAVFIGAFLTNALVNTNPIGLFIIGLGNMLEGVAGYALIQFMCKRRLVKNYTEFYAVCFTAIFPSIISATIATSFLYSAGVIPPTQVDYAWYTWWSGDAIGIMIVLPLFLEYLNRSNYKIEFSQKRILKGVAVTALLFSVIYLVFAKGFNLAFAWALTPVLIYSGFTLGNLLSRWVLLIVTAFIVLLTALGFSPYDYGNLNLNLIYAQSLLTSFSFAILFVKPFDTGFKVSWKFIFGNVIAWAILFLIIYTTFRYERDYTNEDLHRAVEVAMQDLQKTINQDELLVNSAASLLAINPNVTKDDWTKFTSSLRIGLRYKEINGLGIAHEIPRGLEEQYIKSFQKRGSYISEVREHHSDYSSNFKNRYVITFTEPEINRFAIGFDMGSEKIRREALEGAKDSNVSFATPPINLIKSSNLGLLIFRAVHDTNDRFIAFVYAPVDIDTFFNRAFRDSSHVLRLKIFYENKLVYKMDKYPKDIYKNHSYLIEKKFSLFGKTLTVEIYPTARFFTRHSGYSAVLALLMNLFMLFVIGFLLEQITFGQRTEQLVQERTRELENSKMQLVNSSKMASLGEMASGMAHEINNPLTIILGKIKMITLMLKDEKVNNPIINEEMNKMQLTTERIGKIVKGLRTFSRASDYDPFESVLASTVVQETLDLCMEKFKARGIDIRIGEIPNISLNCRPSQISQVLLNLLNNAYDAVSEFEGNEAHWIDMSFEKAPNEFLQISVTDNGRGISDEIVSKIMDPFFTTKGVGKGTGLGLSIAKGIIEDHGGRIWLDQKAKHTRFVVELPYQ